MGRHRERHRTSGPVLDTRTCFSYSDGTSASLVDRRSNRLARALTALGVAPGERVAVACCDEHHVDREVALEAVAKAGATAVSVDDGDVRAVLACAEGMEWWRRTGGRALVIADAPGAVWWKALELRHPPTPLVA